MKCQSMDLLVFIFVQTHHTVFNTIFPIFAESPFIPVHYHISWATPYRLSRRVTIVCSLPVPDGCLHLGLMDTLTGR